jgi:chromosomal replication initiation ATPase DnaA
MAALRPLPHERFAQHRITIYNAKLNQAERIIDLVCEQYDVTRSALLSRRRTGRVVWARHVAIFLAREFTQLDFNTLAVVFRRTNSMVRYSVTNVRDVDPKREREVETLRALVTQNFQPDRVCEPAVEKSANHKSKIK